MAGYFKRRVRPSPNKNELKVRRGLAASGQTRSAGLLSEHYPSVRRLSIRLDFFSPKQIPLDQRSREFGPSDVCDFTAPCPGQCNSGSFDLAEKVRLVIEAKETLLESVETCKQLLYADSPNVCGSQLRYKIEVTYFPQQLAGT